MCYKMKIAMISSEANPLSKSGGLADVVYSLSRELNKFDNETIIITPFYKTIKNKPYKFDYIGYFYVDMSWRHQYVGVFKTQIDGITYFLIDNEYYFLRDSLYGYDDDNERFAYFSLAAIDVLKYVSFKCDIIHVHDWQGGMIPCLLKERYCYDDFYKNIHTVLTIHNPAFKGLMDRYYLANYYGLNDELYDSGKVRFMDSVSTLKSAIIYADKIVAVSPHHRDELLDPNFSHGLDSVLRLREHDFVGIVNGIDVVEFDPKSDGKIVSNYDKTNYSSKKLENKKDLFKSFNMEYVEGVTFGLVSRLTYQKGIDLIFQNIEYLLYKGGNIFVLGSGECDLESRFQYFRDKFPNKIGLYIGYNDMLAHKIYGGVDFFLMPSLFEPCGIGQLVAQRYGTLPIVRNVGGLFDTVIGYDGANENEANGLSFNDYSGLALGDAIRRAFDIYNDKRLLKKLRLNCLVLDRSWTKSMNEYLSIYKGASEK